MMAGTVYFVLEITESHPQRVLRPDSDSSPHPSPLARLTRTVRNTKSLVPITCNLAQREDQTEEDVIYSCNRVEEG